MAHYQHNGEFFDAQRGIDPRWTEVRPSSSTRSSPPRMLSYILDEPNAASFDRSSIENYGHDPITQSARYTGGPYNGPGPASPPHIDFNLARQSSDLASGDDSDILEPILAAAPPHMDSFPSAREYTPEIAVGSPTVQRRWRLSPSLLNGTDGTFPDLVHSADDIHARAQRVQKSPYAVDVLRVFLTHNPHNKPTDQELAGLELFLGQSREDILSWLIYCGHNSMRLETSSHYCGSSGRCGGQKKRTPNPEHRFHCPGGCGYSSNKKDDLRRHMEQNNPSKKYTCHRCFKTYHRSDKFRDHMKTHKLVLTKDQVAEYCTHLEQHDFPRSCASCKCPHATWDEYYKHWVEQHCPPRERSGGSVASQAPSPHEHSQPMAPSFSAGSIKTYPPRRTQNLSSHGSFSNSNGLQTRRGRFGTEGRYALARRALLSENAYPNPIAGYLENRLDSFPGKLLHDNAPSTRAISDSERRARQALQSVEGRFQGVN